MMVKGAASNVQENVYPYVYASLVVKMGLMFIEMG
jgi:hypothetical protein